MPINYLIVFELNTDKNNEHKNATSELHGNKIELILLQKCCLCQDKETKT